MQCMIWLLFKVVLKSIAILAKIHFIIDGSGEKGDWFLLRRLNI